MKPIDTMSTFNEDATSPKLPAVLNTVDICNASTKKDSPFLVSIYGTCSIIESNLEGTTSGDLKRIYRQFKTNPNKIRKLLQNNGQSLYTVNPLPKIDFEAIMNNKIHYNCQFNVTFLKNSDIIGIGTYSYLVRHNNAGPPGKTISRTSCNYAFISLKSDEFPELFPLDLLSENETLSLGGFINDTSLCLNLVKENKKKE